MSRPDTALRRSDELLAVGQPLAALSSVYEIISSGKRFRSTPLSSLEPIMIRFMDLCVMLRKGKHAREGLHTFKNAAQNTSVTAVETVIRHFLDKSKAKLEEALAKVDEIAGPETATSGTTTSTQTTKEDGTIHTVEVEDLEEAETPESILLSTVSDEKSRDRTYRTLVTPWLRFLWESYRTALDTLRNNTRLEVLYQQVALEAFQFCLIHGRKTEFRRLCETLRQHFAYTQKYSSQTYAINISDPETLQRYLDIRFQQLNTAVELELWQEAFRSAEDIHGLVAASKRTPRASMMASFYEKLVKVFAVGQNFLFHAAAYGKLWNLQAATQGHDSQSSDRIAGLVLLSALSVPLSHSHEYKVRKDPITGEEKDYTKGRMTLMGLLDLPGPPSRETLLRDARTALKHVSPELRSLYQIIEVDFHPLHITSKLEPIFAFLRSNTETVRYIEPLKSVVLSRMFQQLAQVYDSVKLARVIKLATFKDDEEAGGTSATKVRIEKFITSACIRGEMSVRLDHSEGIIEFEDKLFEINNSTDSTEAVDFQGSPVDVLQPTPSTLLRTHLIRLAQTLFVSLDTISPSTSALAQAKENAESALQQLAANMAKDREALLSRKLVAEQRKQRAEAEAAKKEKEAEAARAAARAQHAANEAKRVEQEAKAKQLEMIKKNNEAVKAEEARKLADKLKSIGALKVNDKEIDALDTAALMRIQVEKMEKDRREMAEKLRIIGKRIDHTERAFRKEEITLLEKDYELQQKRDQEFFEQTKSSRLEEAKNAHAARLALKHKLTPMLSDIEAFKEKKLQATSAAYQKKIKDSQAKIEEEKAARKASVEKRRAELKEQKRREEEERLQREEEERLRIEEEERRAEEERAAQEAEAARLAEEKEKQDAEIARRRAEREAERAKDAEIVRRQREREEEAERRRAERSRAPPARAVPGSQEWRRNDAPAAATGGPVASNATAESGPPKIPGVKPGSWRARQAAAGVTADATPASSASPPTSRSGTPGAGAPPAAGAAATGERPRFNLQPRTAGAGGAPSWRDREAGQSGTNGTSPAPAAPASPASEAPADAPAAADDGFQTIFANKKPTTGGAYRPPGARGSSDSKWSGR